MWLINTDTLQLQEFQWGRMPEYAFVLSSGFIEHDDWPDVEQWGRKELLPLSVKAGFCELAKKRGLGWAWNYDYCPSCPKEKDADEIKDMKNYVRHYRAAECYVMVPTVPPWRHGHDVVMDAFESSTWWRHYDEGWPKWVNSKHRTAVFVNVEWEVIASASNEMHRFDDDEYRAAENERELRREQRKTWDGSSALPLQVYRKQRLRQKVKTNSSNVGGSAKNAAQWEDIDLHTADIDTVIAVFDSLVNGGKKSKKPKGQRKRIKNTRTDDLDTPSANPYQKQLDLLDQHARSSAVEVNPARDGWIQALHELPANQSNDQLGILDIVSSFGIEPIPLRENRVQALRAPSRTSGLLPVPPKALKRRTSIPPCWIIITLGFLVVGGSLAVGLFYSVASNQIGDGFTVAGWITAAGTLALAVPITSHYPHCKCWKRDEAVVLGSEGSKA